MTHPSRRTLLGSTAGLLALTAGCIADEDDDDPDPGSGSGDNDESANGDDNGTENGTENGDEDDSEAEGENGDEDEDDDDDGTGTDGVSIDNHQYQRSVVSDEPSMKHLRSADDATDWLDERDDLDDDTTAFVDATEFDESVLVALEAGGPNLCYELAVERAELEDDTVVVEAAAVDESTPETACGEQEVTVGAVVRATFDDDPVTDVSVSLTDRDGKEHGMATASDSASDSTSNSTESDA